MPFNLRVFGLWNGEILNVEGTELLGQIRGSILGVVVADAGVQPCLVIDGKILAARCDWMSLVQLGITHDTKIIVAAGDAHAEGVPELRWRDAAMIFGDVYGSIKSFLIADNLLLLYAGSGLGQTGVWTATATHSGGRTLRMDAAAEDALEMYLMEDPEFGLEVVWRVFLAEGSIGDPAKAAARLALAGQTLQIRVGVNLDDDNFEFELTPTLLVGLASYMRLHLLNGIVARATGNQPLCTQCLHRAQAIAARMHVTAESVAAVVLGGKYTVKMATWALRMCNNHPHVALEFLEDQAVEKIQRKAMQLISVAVDYNSRRSGVTRALRVPVRLDAVEDVLFNWPANLPAGPTQRKLAFEAVRLNENCTEAALAQLGEPNAIQLLTESSEQYRLARSEMLVTADADFIAGMARHGRFIGLTDEDADEINIDRELEVLAAYLENPMIGAVDVGGQA